MRSHAGGLLFKGLQGVYCQLGSWRLVDSAHVALSTAGVSELLTRCEPGVCGWSRQGLQSSQYATHQFSASSASTSGSQAHPSSLYQGHASSSQPSSSEAAVEAVPSERAPRQIKVVTQPLDSSSRTGYAATLGSTDLEDLKVPVLGLKRKSRKGSKAADEDPVQEPQPGTSTAAALEASGYKLDAEALKVFEKFVGCMTKDGKKARAQVRHAPCMCPCALHVARHAVAAWTVKVAPWMLSAACTVA